jgi:lysozyme
MDKEQIELLQAELLRDEGFRQFPYRCTAGKLTIGIGRNIEDVGISEDEAKYMLNNDIAECLNDCKVIFGPEWNKFSDVRKRVFLNMRFNLGSAGFRSFKNTINAAKRHEYEMVAYGMKNSKWYNQVGDRAKRLVVMMRKG